MGLDRTYQAGNPSAFYCTLNTQ